MIRIAICDDDPEMSHKIGTMVLECCRESGVSFQEALFQGGRELLYEVEEGAHFDILFLDIKMPQMNGMELTRRLKVFLPEVLVIFITSYRSYVYESFQVQPFRFIPKTRAAELLPVAVKDALHLAASWEGKYLIAENKRALEKIPVKNIVYIWHKGKYAYVEKVNGKETKVRKPLKTIYDELPSDEFVWIDRGCVVGIQQIECITGQEVHLKNGVRLTASMDRLTDLKRQIKSYWMKKG